MKLPKSKPVSERSRKVPKGYLILAVGLPYASGVAIGYHLSAGDVWWLYIAGLLGIVLGVIAITRYSLVIQRLRWDLEDAQRARARDQEDYDAEVRHLHRMMAIRRSLHIY